MAALKINDLFTKISYVFKNDIFIINNKYVIGGSKSELANVGEMFCVLNDDYIELCKSDITETEIISINNIKDAKKDLSKEVNYNIHTTVEENIRTILKNRKNHIKNISEWKKLEFSESDYDDFFNKGLNVELFKDKKLPSITINKNIFPLLTEKTFENFSYNVKINDELCKFICKLELPFFTLYMIYFYLDI